ncbi:bestrophin family protein [Pseudomonas massiliensis]|uniref:bestrophin family protein n=1 Tax=Pseudomonas massiliensis TaxID=522492 RepID=UPI00058F927C|nr:bestrophin family protein [Pseudomonas massiliensis]
MITRPQNPPAATLMFSLKGSIIPAVWRKVLFTVVVSAAVASLHGTLFNFKFVLTATPFTLWGLTLAIFLGFRNTVAYQRYWEARTLWGELLIVARNLTRQTLALLPKASATSRRALALSLVGFAYLLKSQLRGEEPEAASLDRFGVGSVVRNKRNPASAQLGRLGRDYLDAARQAEAGELAQLNMDQQLSRLSYVLGGCERIKGTPIPYPYILLLHRTVYVYCFLLPFCLVDSIGWFTPLAVCILSYTFFGLDALGDQISDPFDTLPNDLPLNAMCRNLEIAVLELLDEPAPAPLEPVDGVLL